MRYLRCFAVAVVTTLVSMNASAQDLPETQQISNWPAPGLWSLTGKVMERGEISPEAAEAVPTAPLHFVGITPCRVADTRGNGFTGQYGPPAVTPAGRNMVIAGQCGIPADAQAVSFNFSAINVTAAGFLTAYPAGAAFPSAATMVYNQNTPNLSNAAVVPLGTGGAITVVAAVTTIDLVVDVNGYYRPGVVTSVTPGTGLAGGGTGAVTLGIAAGGVTGTELGTGAVTSGKIGANAVTAGAIASGQVVKDLNGLHDSVTLVGSGGTTVTPGAGTITIGSSGGGGAPSGSFILGRAGDTTLIGAGYTEVGASDVDFWTATATSGAPSGRIYHTAVWTGTRMIVWGGTPDNILALNTGGRYDPASDSWSSTTTTNAPLARVRHTAVWTGTKMIVWGGNSLTAILLDTGGQYDPVGNAWTATATTNAATGRERHTAVWTGSKMIVWGGNADPDGYSNTGGLYDPAANSWTAGGTSTGANVPSIRESHTAVWTGSRMVVFGGYNGTNFLDTGGRYDPVANTWASTIALGVAYGRSEHTAVWTGTRMIVWGGTQAGLPFLDLGIEYDPVTDIPSIIPFVGAPLARFGHTAVWTGSRMIVWGGVASTPPPNSVNLGFQNNGGIYDPATRTWAAGGTSTTGAPAGRVRHTAVWAGNQMIVWGGDSTVDGFTSTGGRYTRLSLYVKN